MVAVKFTPEPGTKLTYKKTAKERRQERTNKYSSDKWEQDVANFAAMAIGDRNNTLYTLALRGRSLELRGIYITGESKSILLRASHQCGLPYDEAYRTIDSASTTADNNHVEGGTPSNPSTPSATAIVQFPILSSSSITPQLQQVAQEVYLSTLTKKQKIITYVILAYAARHRYLQFKLSTRAVAAAAHVSPETVCKALHAATERNLIGYIRGLGSDTDRVGRTTVIVLNISKYSNNLKIDKMYVDLNEYIESSEMCDEYIKETQEKNRQKRKEWLKAHNISTSHKPLNIIIFYPVEESAHKKMLKTCKLSEETIKRNREMNERIERMEKEFEDKRMREDPIGRIN